jgi:hypothetical protein
MSKQRGKFSFVVVVVVVVYYTKNGDGQGETVDKLSSA